MANLIQTATAICVKNWFFKSMGWFRHILLDVFSELLNFSLLYMVYLIDADYDSA